MEVSSMVCRPQQLLPGGFADTHYRKTGFSSLSVNPREWFSRELKVSGVRDVKVSGFEDKGHLQYYISSVRCGGKKEKEMVVVKDNRDEAKMKKKLKLVKGLSKDLLMFTEMGLVDVGDGLVQEKEQMMKETTNILFAQLQQLKAEIKVMKKKKKEDKAKLKASRMQPMDDMDDSSSSSSSESSDNECEQVVDMKHLRNVAQPESKFNMLPSTVETEALGTSPSECQKADTMCCERSLAFAEPKVNDVSLEIQALLMNPNPLAVEMVEDRSLQNSGQECCTSSVNGNGACVATRALEGRIDVCMGGKCKKMGAPALKEELERRVGVEGAVVGCKCMGKCKSAPNVRVANGGGSTYVAEGADTSIRIPSNPLYIGVGLEDVNAIASYFLGEENQNVSFVAA